MPRARKRIEGIESWDQLEATVSSAIIDALGPVERVHASAMADLVRTVIGLKDLLESEEEIGIQAAREIAALEAMAAGLPYRAEKYGAALAKEFITSKPLGEVLPKMVMQAHALASETGRQASDIAKRQAAYHLAAASLISALRTLGTFYSGKLGLAVISAMPLAVSISFDRYYREITRYLESLGTPEGSDKLAEAVAADLEEIFANFYLLKIKSGIQNISMPAIGGTYSAPLEATGQLRSSISVLSPQHRAFVPIRRTKPRGPYKKHYIVSVGIPEDAGRPAIYGAVLSSSRPSSPRENPRSIFADSIRQRFEEWARVRGISYTEKTLYEGTARIKGKVVKKNRYYSPLDRVMWKVATRGTWGREWLIRIVGGTRVSRETGRVRRVYGERLKRFLKAGEESA